MERDDATDSGDPTAHVTHSYVVPWICREDLNRRQGQLSNYPIALMTATVSHYPQSPSSHDITILQPEASFRQVLDAQLPHT
jgi:hypothetical protein